MAHIMGVKPTVLICIYMLSRDRILLLHLIHEVPLAFLEHLQLRPQAEDGILRSILFLRRTTAKPAPNSRHDKAMK